MWSHPFVVLTSPFWRVVTVLVCVISVGPIEMFENYQYFLYLIKIISSQLRGAFNKFSDFFIKIFIKIL